MIVPALAYLHGYYVGRNRGIREGAGKMFDRLWKGGTLTKHKNERIVTLTNDE
jgi:hypothetical protein